MASSSNKFIMYMATKTKSKELTLLQAIERVVELAEN